VTQGIDTIGYYTAFQKRSAASVVTFPTQADTCPKILHGSLLLLLSIRLWNSCRVITLYEWGEADTGFLSVQIPPCAVSPRRRIYALFGLSTCSSPFKHLENNNYIDIPGVRRLRIRVRTYARIESCKL
jgi:hypothetical protein